MIIKDMERYIEGKKIALHDALRLAFLEIGVSIIENTPVDEGFARGSWTFSQSKNPVFNSKADKSGQAAISSLENGVSQAKKYAVYYLLSNLVYMPRLEYGWSQQAPAGMIRTSINRFETELRKRINETK